MPFPAIPSEGEPSGQTPENSLPKKVRDQDNKEEG